MCSMSLTEETYCQKLVASLSHLREQEFLTDVILIAGETRIAAHRNVLSAFSEYFRAMFSESYQESNKEVVINSIDGEILEVIVDFCYSGTLKAGDYETIMSILEASVDFGTESVTEICYSYLKENLDSSNCLEVFSVADRHNVQSLRDAAFQMIVNNFNEVRCFENFAQLNAEQVGQLLQSNELNVRSGRDVFDALMDWYNFDKENRESALSILVGLLTLPPLPPSVTRRLLLKQSIDYDEMMQLILNSDWNALPTTQCPGLAFKNRLVGVSIQFQTNGNKVLQWMWYDEMKNRWENASSLKIDISNRVTKGHQVLIGNSVLYLVHWSGNFCKYSLATKKWESCSLQQKNAGFACMGDSLYVVGGERIMQSFDTSMDYLGELKGNSCNEIHSKNTMTHERKTPGVCVAGDKLYAIGGLNREGEEVDHVECYDSTSDLWIQYRELPTKIDCPSLVVFNGNIYCAPSIFKRDGQGRRWRDFNVEKIMYRYNQADGMWSEIPVTMHAIKHASMSIFNKELFLAGKTFHGDTVVMAYKPVQNSWRTIVGPSDDHFQLLSLPEDALIRNNWLKLMLT